ncbi:sulfite exporter TauE/SafE family protein [Seongchinamella sediminis]|uniref:Probable membrane transporter protein n=1 Tax=Seongchinamella sediminis TaxID=2283635 RepID=A0A3L7DRI9_9GAMM|nr:sulfite exporter TauE/SafE family protein [Seongchinamella sediminis]RLQ20267.1 sulfite exporter TauE/SafE family protein [Seongchinamella sediminis]
MIAEYTLVPIAFLTSALAGVMGMGGGVLLIAAMPGLVPVYAIFPLHAATQLASNLSRAGFGWRHIQWDIAPAITLGAVLGAMVGGEIYASLNLHWLPLVIGLLILLLTWVPLPQARGRGQWALLGLGFYQTSLGMLAGATGPLGAAVLLRRNAQRDWLVVNTAVYMSLSHALRLAAFIVLGFSFASWWPLLLAMVLAVTAGSWVGTRLRKRVPQIDFQRWFRWLVTLLALRMIALPFFAG